MSKFDLVVFGATGFTGKHVVFETIRVTKKYPEVTWAIAGRSQQKLDAVKQEAAKRTGIDISQIKTIIADVKDEESLMSMCSGARVVVNCCGPYRLYGEPVVRAAIRSRAHYVDVTGEPQFMEEMQLAYNEEARAAGVYVVHACGFDSIPNDLGVEFLRQNFDGTLNSVESYLSFELASPNISKEALSHGMINYGTWESLVHGLAHQKELGPLRKKLFPERMPTFKPKLEPRSAIHKHDGTWCLPFAGADNSVVYRTQRHLYEVDHKRPVQFRAYFELSSLGYAIAIAFVSLMLFLMTKLKITRDLLLKYPRVFSLGYITKEGPKEEVMENTYFQFALHGVGWSRGSDVDSTPPNKKMVAVVSSRNPGYGATVTGLVFSALTVLKQQDKMPSTGGVMTTGVAFGNTDLIKHLNENNFKFEILENK